MTEWFTAVYTICFRSIIFPHGLGNNRTTASFILYGGYPYGKVVYRRKNSHGLSVLHMVWV